MRENARPTESEVKEAFDRLIDDPVFSVSDAQRALFKHIVAFSLKGEEKTGTEVMTAVFPLSAPDGGNVKVHMHGLRSNLETYYKTRGSRDFVLIELPKGRVYRAAFSYRYKPDAIKLYERGMTLMGGEGRTALYQATECFDMAICADGKLAQAYVGRLEASICDGLLSHVLGTTLSREDLAFGELLDGEIEALEMNPDSWWAWCLHGVARLAGRGYLDATRAFEKALLLDERQTGSNICYAFYLLLTNDRAKALKVAESWDFSADARLLIARGLFFYLCREDQLMIQCLQSFGVPSEEMEFLRDTLQALAYFDSESFEKAHFSLFWATSMMNDPRRFREKAERRSLMGEFKTKSCEARFWDGPLPNLFPGLNILMLIKNGPAKYASEARELVARLKEQVSLKPFQIGVACMAVGEREQAVAYFNEAAYCGDVLALHLDKWPFLSDMTDFGPFEELKRLLATLETESICSDALASADRN